MTIVLKDLEINASGTKDAEVSSFGIALVKTRAVAAVGFRFKECAFYIMQP